MDRPGVRQVQEGNGEQGKTEKTGCKIICGAPTTLAVKGLMMMMMINLVWCSWGIFKEEEAEEKAMFFLYTKPGKRQLNSAEYTRLCIEELRLQLCLQRKAVRAV